MAFSLGVEDILVRLEVSGRGGEMKRIEKGGGEGGRRRGRGRRESERWERGRRRGNGEEGE